MDQKIDIYDTRTKIMRGSQAKMSMDSNEKTVFKTEFTGLDEFDRFTGGLKRGQVTVLAARPAMGKTTFALNAAWNVCQKEAVAYFSLDYSKTQLVGRLLCMISGAGNANKAGWVKIANAAESISHSDLIIDDDQDNSVFFTGMIITMKNLRKQERQN